jgi:signal transduction histidine kinase
MGRRPGATDVLAALALAGVMEVQLLFVEGSRADLTAARGGVLVLCAGVAVRRSVPVLAAALAIGGVILTESAGQEVSGDLVLSFLIALLITYSVGAYSDGRELLAGLAILLVGSAIAVTTDPDSAGVEDLFFAYTIVVGGPVLLGRLVRSRRRLNEALSEKAQAAEHDRAASAVADERRRIAGELHHLVSASLEKMVGQAAAAEQLVRIKPEVAERAFASVEETGRAALAEIRALLGVLRREDEDLALAPQPSLGHVADLVARVRAAGLPVELDVEGVPPPLPAGLDLTAYRVLQEALGGAAEAPGPRSAAVRLRYSEDEVALEVTDVGSSPAERRLLGIHERVALYGGDLVAEPVADSGYSVRVRLPLEPVS